MTRLLHEDKQLWDAVLENREQLGILTMCLCQTHKTHQDPTAALIDSELDTVEDAITELLFVPLQTY